jgi:hypothetical protein
MSVEKNEPIEVLDELFMVFGKSRTLLTEFLKTKTATRFLNKEDRESVQKIVDKINIMQSTIGPLKNEL